MKRLLFGMALGLLSVTSSGGQDLPQWVLNLSKIKRQARAGLEHVPNYVCRETVNRSEISAAGKVRPVDTLRLDVAYIGGKEQFAPPGARFQDLDLTAYASTGAFGTGTFAGIARNLFVADGGRTTGWGEEKLAGRSTIWYGFEISQMFKSYKVQSDRAEAYVGQAGKYWVDADTLELLRIEAHAVDIPPIVGMRDITDIIDYAKVSIGNSLLLLPQRADTLIANLDGTQHRNVTEFSGCREYSSESVIRFGPDEPETKPPAVTRKK